MHSHDNETMISVEEARERILQFVWELDKEKKPMLKALGQILAEDIVSYTNIPPLDNSAMDGFAVQSDSVRGASIHQPQKLQIVGSISAGQLPSGHVKAGTAIRIMTGAPIPTGADAVIPFENTNEMEQKRSGKLMPDITVYVEANRRDHIRPAGEDVKAGQLVMKQGTVLKSAEMGLLASLGYLEVSVIRKPTVAIFSTGNELVPPGVKLDAGKIFDSNSYGIASAVQQSGGIPRLLGIAKDNEAEITSKLKIAIESDLVITSAGVSKGDYDIVKDVIAKHGSLELWSVRMRPAKPIAFGLLDHPGGNHVPHLGLPGNPVSALVGFEQLGRPIINKMLGKDNYERPVVDAILEDRIINTDGRRVYARVIVEKRDGVYYAKLAGQQGSNILTSMSRSNGLAICPENLPEKRVGEIIEVQMTDWADTIA